MIRDIKCQNCLNKIGINQNGTIVLDTKKTNTAIQALDNDSSLLTLQCDKCSCLIQLKV